MTERDDRMLYSMEKGWKQQKNAPDNAGDVARALHKIEDEDNGITPKRVVEVARSAASPLHAHFEWDDTLAGENWRIEQARSLISNVRVRIKDAPHRPPTRAFVHVPAKDPHYGSAHLVMSDREKRALVLHQALAEIMSFRRRYAELEELAGVVRAMDMALERMQARDQEGPRI